MFNYIIFKKVHCIHDSSGSYLSIYRVDKFWWSLWLTHLDDKVFYVQMVAEGVSYACSHVVERNYSEHSHFYVRMPWMELWKGREPQQVVAYQEKLS